MFTPNFIHLHLHTEYSLVDGLIGIKPLIKRVIAAGMPAVAITDQSNLFAMVKFYQAAEAAGIKPIVGSDIWVNNPADNKKPFRLVLLCQNQIGYKNLTQLISRSYLQKSHLHLPILDKTWFKDLAQGLIALSGAQEGDIGQALLANQTHIARQCLEDWLALFPNRFYLELQRSGHEHEEKYLAAALHLAQEHAVPVVATNNVRFLAAEDFEAHEARVCIHNGWVLNDSRRPAAYTSQQYLKSPEEMQQLFADIPEALENSVVIAQRCNLELSLDQTYLPNFPTPPGMSVDAFFQQESRTGLEQRLLLLAENPAEDISSLRQCYQDRLEMEMTVIQNMGFTGYFLIVADFIRWAKQQHIPVGPGRGSGAGSLVAYAMQITDLDPIKHDLLFERFLNPERVSMADFDIDFCMEGRDRVIDYVANKYGRDSVAQIITYGTMAAKAVLRDVGRVMGYPYGFVDKIAKLIPFEIGITLKKALVDEAQLLQRYQQEEEVKSLVDLAMKLEGVPRNVGKHAGGVVIAPSVLTDFTPLYCEPGGDNPVTQFDKDDVEKVGLVKFDFLGLRTLTIIDWALQTINTRQQQQNQQPIVLSRIPLDDIPTFNLLKACETTAVFQLESRGFKDLVRRLQPDHFGDIVALVALFRPGPLQSGMVEDFINRKHGRAKVEYLHPALEPILRPTYGVIVYQEQVMQMAQVLAGYTLGGADILRRAMGKKKPEEMAKQRAIFVNGAQQRSISSDIANQIFDLMEMFADYGFNKSHSAAYALLSYQTAWLKAHFPAEYMAAVLSADMDNTDKVVKFIEECQKMGLRITAPTIHQSDYKFTVGPQGEILYGLGAIKGVGQAAVENILEQRNTRGPYPDLFAFCQRVDTRKANRKVLEALIRSGAFDAFGVNRASLMASLDTAIQAAEQHSRAQECGQNDLFAADLSMENAASPYLSVPAWSDEERLAGEKETLGWYLSGHPITRYQQELAKLTPVTIAALTPNKDKTLLVAGFVTSLRTMQTKSGGRIAFLSLDDGTGRIELAVFSQLYANCRDLLVKDQLIIVEGEVSVDEFTDNYKLTGRQVYNLATAREQFAVSLSLKLQQQQLTADFMQDLQQALTPFCGGKCLVYINYHQEELSTRLALGEQWKVRPEEQLLTTLSKICGQENVSVDYRLQ